MASTPVLFSLLLMSGTAWAQVDAGSLLRETQPSMPTVPTLQLPVVQPKLLQDTGAKVLVKGFAVTGSTQFDTATWNEVLKDFVGQELGFAGLQAAADRVSLHYRKAGLHATAVLPEQTLTDGVVRILVVEGRFGTMRLETPEQAERIPSDRLLSILGQGQKAGEIVNIDALERATLIANDMPGVKLSSLLTAGTKAGETDIVAQAEVRDALTGTVSLDNFDPRSTGRAKLAASLSANSLLGHGEQFILSAQATQGKKYGQLSFSHPMGANGLRGGLSLSHLDYELQGSFAASGGKGSADTLSANLNYPVIRAQARNLVAALVATRSHQINDSSAGNLSDKVDQSLNMGLSGNNQDQMGGGGVTIAGLNLFAGDIDLSGNASELAQDAAGPRRHGAYTKLQMNAARLQRLTGGATAWLSANGQYAFDNLDSGQKFSLGGVNGVRAYPSLEASGDQGIVFTAEYRNNLSNRLQAKVFYDWGRIILNHETYIGATARNGYALQGAGVGLDWTASDHIALRGLLAWRLGNNPAAQTNGSDSDGTRRIPQIWLTAQADF